MAEIRNLKVTTDSVGKLESENIVQPRDQPRDFEFSRTTPYL